MVLFCWALVCQLFYFTLHVVEMWSLILRARHQGFLVWTYLEWYWTNRNYGAYLLCMDVAQIFPYNVVMHPMLPSISKAFLFSSISHENIIYISLKKFGINCMCLKFITNSVIYWKLCQLKSWWSLVQVHTDFHPSWSYCTTIIIIEFHTKTFQINIQLYNFHLK